MKITTKLPAGEIIKINPLPDGTYEVVQEVAEKTNTIQQDAFVLIEAELLSENDAFLHHEPKTEPEKRLKELILLAIRKKVKNFERPRCDPSFSNGAHTDICFVPGKMPAVGKSYNWWKKIAQKYNLKLGTRLQYAAFLGVLIKKLIEEGKSVEWAWNAVCNDSTELGHYCNSKNAKREFELTGSRLICGFYDLANTDKILEEDEDYDFFWFAGGNYLIDAEYAPLGVLGRNYHFDFDLYVSVGWLVRQ